jgi:hypothetical protein
LVGASVADRLARSIDAAGKRRICDNSPSPDIVDHVVLADNPVAVFKQVYKEIEHLRLDGHAAPATAQFPAIRVKYMIGKDKLHTPGSGPRETIKPI